MQVSVLVRDGADDEDTPLLVLPFGTKAEIPEHLRCTHWRELATATTDDRLLWHDQVQIEHDIQRLGYSLLAARPVPEGTCSLGGRQFRSGLVTSTAQSGYPRS